MSLIELNMGYNKKYNIDTICNSNVNGKKSDSDY